MRMTRENLRSTQIMLEKVETLRLYSWSDITSPGFVPTNFTANYDPQGGNAQGLTYNGTIAVSDAPILASYSNELKQVTVHLSWKTGKLQRDREFTTFVARNGIQDYVY